MPGEISLSPDYKPNGASVAAVASAAFGLLVLGLVALATELSERAKEVVFDVGKAWIPNGEGIGPYSGKETFLLVGWLGSWLILHFVLRNREVDTKVWFGAALALLLVATLLVWPPVWHFLGAE